MSELDDARNIENANNQENIASFIHDIAELAEKHKHMYCTSAWTIIANVYILINQEKTGTLINELAKDSLKYRDRIESMKGDTHDPK